MSRRPAQGRGGHARSCGSPRARTAARLRRSPLAAREPAAGPPAAAARCASQSRCRRAQAGSPAVVAASRGRHPPPAGGSHRARGPPDQRRRPTPRPAREAFRPPGRRRAHAVTTGILIQDPVQLRAAPGSRRSRSEAGRCPRHQASPRRRTARLPRLPATATRAWTFPSRPGPGSARAWRRSPPEAV